MNHPSIREPAVGPADRQTTGRVPERSARPLTRRHLAPAEDEAGATCSPHNKDGNSPMGHTETPRTGPRGLTVSARTGDVSRRRRFADPARLAWYAQYRARRFARRFGAPRAAHEPAATDKAAPQQKTTGL
jgi:hypothetical protein